jgi:gliding motility-associated-like protein
MGKLITIFLLLLSFTTYSQCAGDITFTLNPTPNLDLTYPPNTDVELCVTMTGWNPSDANWFEGFGLSLGIGWESVVPVTSPLTLANDGNWIWLENVTSSATGQFAGPGYFFENTGGGGGGPVDGNSGNDWGDFCIGVNCTWQFCVLLTSSSTSGDDLGIQITPYADGTLGGYGSNCPDPLTCYNNCFDPPDDIFDGEVGCLTLGCVDVVSCNYDPNAGCDDGSCTYSGCTDPVACNYNLEAACDDGSCTYGGCTDPLACNFNPTAGCDDGSCGYFTMGEVTHNLISCPDTVCTGLSVTYAVTGNENSIYDWQVNSGGVVQTDQSKNCEITWGNTPGTYMVSVQETTPEGCEGEILTCDIEVVVPDITFDTSLYRICLNQTTELVAYPEGGSWSSQYVNLRSFTGTTPGTFYPEYTTNVYGCDITESVKVIVKQKYDAPEITYASEFIDLCIESGEAYYLTPDSLNYTYSWFIENSQQPESSNGLFVQWPDTSRVYLIKVIGYDEIGCESEPSLISINVESCQRFFAPNSFTPNGDGINDVFKISGMSVYTPTLKVFDRWGSQIYTSSNLWWTGDGGSGYYCNTDVYNWIVEYRDKNGFNKVEGGFVTLVR